MVVEVVEVVFELGSNIALRGVLHYPIRTRNHSQISLTRKVTKCTRIRNTIVHVHHITSSITIIIVIITNSITNIIINNTSSITINITNISNVIMINIINITSVIIINITNITRALSSSTLLVLSSSTVISSPAASPSPSSQWLHMRKRGISSVSMMMGPYFAVVI